MSRERVFNEATADELEQLTTSGWSERRRLRDDGRTVVVLAKDGWITHRTLHNPSRREDPEQLMLWPGSGAAGERR